MTPRTSAKCTIPGIRVANFLPVLVLVGGGGLLLACERPSPDAVERWRRAGDTDKLTGVLADRDLAPDLRARAAQALITVGDPKETLAALRRLPDAAAVAKPLLGLLWEDARLQSQLQVPTLPQIRAKDALYDLRDFDPPTVDGYLVDWITGYYEERAGFGIHQGEEILRTVGAKAAPKLIAAARETLDLGSVDGKYTPIADNHLRALALTGATEFLLDLTREENADESLPSRAFAALVAAPPGALGAILPRLRTIAASTTENPAIINRAFELIAATGKDNCLKPFVELAKHAQPIRGWMAAYHALDCAKLDAIVPISDALPQDRELDRAAISHYFWDKIVAFGPDAVPPARQLLESPSWVARLTGIAVLEKVGTVKDVERLRALEGDATRVRGFGTTVGQEAKVAAERLEKPR
ncbi:MAG TPA: hypothetical protein VKE22_06710 [Haliangiales bacterium]|nr:hypothetical protein [Haliangiales bacterium]